MENKQTFQPSGQRYRDLGWKPPLPFLLITQNHDRPGMRRILGEHGDFDPVQTFDDDGQVYFG